MNTTLNKIQDNKPCKDGWKKLLKSLGKTKSDDEPLSLEYILKSNSIEDAVWCLRCFDYLDYCLFNADVAQLVLPIFEAKYPDDKRPREAIECIRLYKNNVIDKEELTKLSKAASAAYAVYATYGAYAAYASYAFATSASAAHAASAVYATYAAHASREESWIKIEALFVKHFC